MEKLKLKDVPRLKGNSVIVSNKELKTLVEYINTQTTTINTLLSLVNELTSLCESHSNTISTLETRIAILAKAIGGQLDV